jgi:hypothetical protein
MLKVAKPIGATLSHLNLVVQTFHRAAAQTSGEII